MVRVWSLRKGGTSLDFDMSYLDKYMVFSLISVEHWSRSGEVACTQKTYLVTKAFEDKTSPILLTVGGPKTGCWIDRKVHSRFR